MAIGIESGDILMPNQFKKHLKIYAGPGAGKTYFLVENVKNLISKNPMLSESKNRKILCVTYTNAAVDEIKRRLNRESESVEVYTIHGFIIENIIKPFQQELRDVMKLDFDIDVSRRKRISSQPEGMGILHGIEREDIYKYIQDLTSSEVEEENQYSKKIMGEVAVDLTLFSESINKGEVPVKKINASKKIDKDHVMAIKKYAWAELGKLTHDEVLYFGYRILESNPTALYAIRVMFPFIFVDEFQDTNPIQTMIAKIIGKKSTIIGVIGDVAQSIYSFQGAKPTDFDKFLVDGDQETTEYLISGNRRSTKNIVHFCNFIRSSDRSINQESIKQYETPEIKQSTESKKIQFLIGDSLTVKETINNVLNDNGVVLTRAWAAAFSYIQDIEEEQVNILKQIYNSYYSSPIQLRDEIIQHNNVIWVKAFRFIFNFWESWEKGSLIDVLNTLKSYTTIEIETLSPKLIFKIQELGNSIFQSVSEQALTVDIIEKLNSEIRQPNFAELFRLVFGDDFYIPIFSEFDKDKLVSNVSQLTWSTSFKLFNEVFSTDSKYMTVHQAKGLEWNKVIVSVTPNKFDKIKLNDMYAKPSIVGENAADEFTRMYFVACSRAKEELYVHLPSEIDTTLINNSLASFIDEFNQEIDFEIIS
ncbi:UvrD-helicase domain-containing protein [Enterococcus faecalis]|uniref:UvrD-helicase domain-containing protein n=1 Tax=Enterococcus faecalis TaxID=1351 RepID=UPI0035CC6956